MVTVDDDELMSPQQRELLREVIIAVENGASDVYSAVARKFDPPPSHEDVDTILRILGLEAVDYQQGEPVAAVVGRILDLLEAVAEGEDIEPRPSDMDDRY